MLPSLALLACVVLALATCSRSRWYSRVCCASAQTVTTHSELTVLPVAIMSLKATTLRSLALAATGAVALFGSVALGGSRDDLLRGIDAYTAHYAGGAESGSSIRTDNQATNDFAADHRTARIARLPGVASVHAFQGELPRLGRRRVWVIAWPPEAPLNLLDGQIIARRVPPQSATRATQRRLDHRI